MQLAKFKRIFIFGLGRSGLGAAKLLKHHGYTPYGINSGDVSSWYKKEVSSLFLEENCFSEASVSPDPDDLLILSPGIPGTHPVCQKFSHMWGEIELGFHFCSSPIIAVTGTNGKTTTVSMLQKLFEIAGEKVLTAGNIGNSFCESLIESKKWKYILLELSSFQLESLESFKAHIGLILNLMPNHSERYNSDSDYFSAKLKIADRMEEMDHFIYSKGEKFIEDQKHLYSATVHKVNLQDSDLLQDYDLSKLKVIGDHNLYNFRFVEEVAQVVGLTEHMQTLLNSFMGVPHRLEKLSTKKLVLNDAKSTNWAATISAIESIAEYSKKIHLVIGGAIRGNDDPEDTDLKVLRDHCKSISLIGESGKTLEGIIPNSILLRKFGEIKTVFDRMDEDEVLLFSPAYPSFDMFENYVKRGEEFKSLFIS